VLTTQESELKDEEKADIRQRITENTERITGLVNKMLELSEANSHTVIECNDDIPAMMIATQAADQAGIKKEDVIVKVDSTLIKSPSDLQVVVNNFHPGDKALVTVVRDGKAKQLEVQFQGTSEITGTVGADGSVAFYGARIGMGDKGVTILSAGSGKLAQAGGEDGFVIQFVNDQRVNKPQDVIDIAKKARRSIVIEGVTATGRQGYFAFGKEE
jgi:S1-C subfamily serine protease